jgi:hypothetical protein
MWLDAVPYAPSLRLDDQSFQEAGRVRTGVRAFSSFGTCWTCSCSHPVEDDIVAHTLGCNRPSGLVQTRPDETAVVLREFVGRLGFSSSREGQYSRLAPRTPTVPRHAATLTATCAPGRATFSPTSLSPNPWLFLTFVPPPAPLAMPLLFGTPTSAGTILPTTTARDMHSARSLLNLGEVQSQGHAIPLRSSPRCFPPTRAPASRPHR